MKKVLFTESQFNMIMEMEGLDFEYLSSLSGPEQPCSNGNEVSVDPEHSEDSKVPTTSDKVSTMNKGGNIPYGGFRRCIKETNSNLDNSTAIINKKKLYGDGKMINNIRQRAQNGGQRLNTTEVELSRLKSQKKEDPMAYQRNGGKQTEKSLKALKNRQRNMARVSKEGDDRMKSITTPNTPNAKQQQKGHHDGEELNNGGILHYPK